MSKRIYMMSNTREHLRKLIETRCLITNAGFTLSTGKQSDFYFDCKAVTLEGDGLSLIAQEVLKEIEAFENKPAAIGGLTMGADFVVAAVAMKAFEAGKTTIHGSIVRKETKKHGTKNKIENQLPQGTKIVVVDDVITSGKSTDQACEEFLNAGYEIVGILAVVDREAGGKQFLEQKYGAGIVRSLFKKADFPALSVGDHNDGTGSIRTAVA